MHLHSYHMYICKFALIRETNPSLMDNQSLHFLNIRIRTVQNVYKMSKDISINNLCMIYFMLNFLKIFNVLLNPSS